TMLCCADSLVQTKAACVEHTLMECEVNGERAVSETLSGLLESSTVAQCRIQLSDSRCGLYAVSALSSFMSSISLLPEDFDFCPLVAPPLFVLLAGLNKKKIYIYI
ncbi:MAG: hypothetical protein KAH03_07095, partial [Cocleimonas sp.]|nr:hypothetical protein [Cocleimonas sp.]